jgi:ubiquitin C
MISLRVDPDETLYDVKKKLMEKHNLVFDGVCMDNDCHTLADYNIKRHSTLDLHEKVQIYVKETVRGLIYTIDVDSLDTIDNIKDKIEAINGFPKHRQCLIFADQRLKGKRTLADYNICKDSTLLLVHYQWIFVKMLDGRTETLKVKSSDTVDSVKVKIYDMEEIRPVDQRLVFGGYQLEGNRTLASYKIRNHSTIHLTRRLCGS